MTKQMLDSFTYRGESVNAIAISEVFPFSPHNDFGIETGYWTTSNYRGFWCDYSIDDSIIVQNLFLFSHDKAYPPIKGKQAEEIPMYANLLRTINAKTSGNHRYIDGFPMQYLDINYVVDYNGNIVLGIGAKRNKQGLVRYNQVLELSFEDGIMVDSNDISSAWRSFASNEDSNADKYWWANEEKNYAHLINYHSMGSSFRGQKRK